MDKLIDLLGTAGGPTTVIGICLTLLFWIRRQDTGIRTEINGSLQRLTVEKESQQAELEETKEQLEKKEAIIDQLREERRKAEDTAAEIALKAREIESELRLAKQELARLKGTDLS